MTRCACTYLPRTEVCPTAPAQRNGMRTWKPWPDSNRTPSGTRFAGGQLHLELTKATSTREGDRTPDLRIRIPALCPLSYAGMVRAEGFEPPQQMQPGYSRPRLTVVGALAWGDRPELNRRLQGHNLALCH